MVMRLHKEGNLMKYVTNLDSLKEEVTTKQKKRKGTSGRT